MYEIRGYIFSPTNGPLSVREGIRAEDYEDAKKMFKESGISNYLFTLVEVKD